MNNIQVKNIYSYNTLALQFGNIALVGLGQQLTDQMFHREHAQSNWVGLNCTEASFPVVLRGRVSLLPGLAPVKQPLQLCRAPTLWCKKVNIMADQKYKYIMYQSVRDFPRIYAAGRSIIGKDPKARGSISPKRPRLYSSARTWLSTICYT